MAYVEGQTIHDVLIADNVFVDCCYGQLWGSGNAAISVHSGAIPIASFPGRYPNDNIVISEYLKSSFKIPSENIGVISGPCHAEEVALETDAREAREVGEAQNRCTMSFDHGEKRVERAWVARDRIDIDEHRGRAHREHHVAGRHPGQRGRDDLVAGADAQQPQRDFHRHRTGHIGEDRAAAEVLGQRLLEFRAPGAGG